MFEGMLKSHLGLDPSEDVKFDFYSEGTPMQVKTTTGNSLRLGRYKNGLEIGQDFYLIFAKHKSGEITEARSFLVDGHEYNNQFLFTIQHYFDEYIKPLPDRSGKYQDYCSDLKYMARNLLVTPEVKKGGGGNNRLQSYIQIKDIPKISTEVDLELDSFLNKSFAAA